MENLSLCSTYGAPNFPMGPLANCIPSNLKDENGAAARLTLDNGSGREGGQLQTKKEPGENLAVVDASGEDAPESGGNFKGRDMATRLQYPPQVSISGLPEEYRRDVAPEVFRF